MEDLLQLESCRDPHPLTTLPTHLSQIGTPIRLQAWEAMLSSFPNQRLARYLLGGFTEGFRIGFPRESRLRSARHNLSSASEHPTIISDYIALERAAGAGGGPETAD